MAATPAHALRLVNWNILNYPGTSGATRDPNYRTVLGPVGADAIVTEEMTSQAGVDEFVNNVLNVLEPGQWAAAPFDNGNDTDCGFFYKPAKVQFLGQWSFYPNPANLLRLVHVYRVVPAGYASGAAELRIYATHLKASQGFESQRLAEATGIRDSMNAMPPGTHAFVTGDFNVYTNTEGAYLKFLESQGNNVGRCVDLLPAGVWHDGGSFASIHTQSTCLSGCSFGEATGGMDDRFDFMLPTPNLTTGQGLACIPGTMFAVGQDGQHLNKSITDSPTIPQGAAYAAALLGTSDHLPVRVDLQVPSKLALDTSPIALGTVIVGASASHHLTISNTATPPADALDCTYSAPAGSSASGPPSVAAGASGDVAIALDTGAPQTLFQQLTITTDAPDSPPATIIVSGTVLDHARASVVPTGPGLIEGSIEFGEHAGNEFQPVPVSVYNAEYGEQRAKLSVTSATITGAEGRFSISGFSPALVAESPATWNVTFDPTLAPPGSSFEGTLTFESSDEPLPGAAAQPNLTFTLRASMRPGSEPKITATSGPHGDIDQEGAVSVIYGGDAAFNMVPDPNCHVVDVQVDGASVGAVSSYTFTHVVTDHTIAATFESEIGPAAVGDEAPTSLSFAIAGANPVTGIARFRLGLPAPAPVDAAVFDATGRRVATLANGMLPAGYHSLVWRGNAPPGIYFAVLKTGGVALTRRIVRLR